MRNEDIQTTTSSTTSPTTSSEISEEQRQDQIYQLGNVMNLSFYAVNRLKQLSPDALAELVYVFNIKPPTGV